MTSWLFANRDYIHMLKCSVFGIQHTQFAAKIFNFRLLSGQELPVRADAEFCGIRLQRSRRIVFRINTDGNNVQLAGRLLLEFLLHLVSISVDRSEEHTSELQSLTNLVCRLLLEKKKKKHNKIIKEKKTKS